MKISQWLQTPRGIFEEWQFLCNDVRSKHSDKHTLRSKSWSTNESCFWWILSIQILMIWNLEALCLFIVRSSLQKIHSEQCNRLKGTQSKSRLGKAKIHKLTCSRKVLSRTKEQFWYLQEQESIWSLGYLG